MLESLTGRRSWILQERLLSPRVVHFGATQIMWECRTKECCETYPHGLPDSTSDVFSHFKGLRPHVEGAALRTEQNARPQRRSIDDANTSLLSHGERPDLDGYYIWARIVEAYSRTNISFDKDKLVAVYGIASHMQAILNDEYIAGLWKSILPSQLVWRIEEFTFLAVLDAASNPRDRSRAVAKPALDDGSRVAPSWSVSKLMCKG